MREVVQESADAPLAFTSVGPTELKGVAGRVELFRASRRDDPDLRR